MKPRMEAGEGQHFSRVKKTGRTCSEMARYHPHVRSEVNEFQDLNAALGMLLMASRYLTLASSHFGKLGD